MVVSDGSMYDVGGTCMSPGVGTVEAQPESIWCYYGEHGGAWYLIFLTISSVSPAACSFNWPFGVLSYPERVGTPVIRPGSDYSAYYSVQFLMKDHVPQASPSISNCRHQCCSFSFFTSHPGLNARHAGTISCILDWLFPRRFTVGLAGCSAHQSLGP